MSRRPLFRRRSRLPMRLAAVSALGGLAFALLPATSAAAVDAVPTTITVAAEPVPVPPGADLSLLPAARRTVFLPIAAPLAAAMSQADATGIDIDLPLFDDVRVRVAGTFDSAMSDGSKTWLGRGEDGPGGEDVAVLTLAPNSAGTAEVEIGYIWHDGDLYALHRVAAGVLAVVEVTDDAFVDNHVHPQPMPEEPEADSVVDPLAPEESEYSVDSEAVATSSYEATAGADAYVDVLVLYTPAADAARSDSMSGLAANLVGIANSANAADGIGHRFRIVATVALSFTETKNDAAGDLRSMIINPTVDNLRAQYGADLVAYMGAGYSTTPQPAYNNQTVCGLGYEADGWSSTWRDAGYSMWDVSPDCGPTRGAHELGHNVTLRHDWPNDARNGAGSPYSPAYNHGYLSIPGDFRTIMSYNNTACPGGGCARIPYWSNPNKTYGGFARGQSESLPLPAHDARAVATAMPGVAKWFTAYNPFGKLEDVRAYPNGVRVVGYAMDPDTRNAINVQLYVDGVATGSPRSANVYRSDVYAKHPGYGYNHGFSFTAAVGGGTHTLCVRALNVATGTVNTDLGCLTHTVAVNPVGNITSYNRIPGGVRIYGWALDPDTSGSISVKVLEDGVHTKTVTANSTVVATPSTYTDWGSGHGFYADVHMSSEVAHAICVRGVNVDEGAETQLDCLNLTLSGKPTGSFTTIYNEPGGIAVEGWGLDPDTTGRIGYQFTIDGVTKTPAGGYNYLSMSLPSAWSAWSSDRGFYYWFTGLSAGSHTVCVTALNYAGTGGTSTSLGCRTIYYTHDPVGAFTVTALAGGAVRVDGWALDPDSVTQVQVQVTYAGVPGPPVVADAAWSGDPSYPAGTYGTQHGFSTTGVVGLNPETRTVCVTVKNVGTGADSSLGCQTPL